MAVKVKVWAHHIERRFINQNFYTRHSITWNCPWYSVLQTVDGSWTLSDARTVKTTFHKRWVWLESHKVRKYMHVPDEGLKKLRLTSCCLGIKTTYVAASWALQQGALHLCSVYKREYWCFKPHFKRWVSKVQMIQFIKLNCFGSDHYWSVPHIQTYCTDLWGLWSNCSVNTGGCRTKSSGSQTLIIGVWGRFGWRGSCWWRWRRPGWASATAASWRTSSCAAPIAPTPSSASRSSGLPDASTGSESGKDRKTQLMM